MALQRLPGCNNQWLWAPPPVLNAPTFTSILLDAAADRVTMIGHFTHQDQATKTVDGVEFLLGAVSKANGSTLQVSLQDVDVANGPVMREDGTPDQTLTIANADAGLVTNAWYGGDFDAAGTRTLAMGELVCVVFQFGTFVAGDTVNVRGLTLVSANEIAGRSGVVANLTGAVATQAVLPNVVLRCSDGTFGTLGGAWPCTAVNSHAVNVGTAVADEYALGLQFPFACASNAVWSFQALAGATFATEVLLYAGTTALQTVTMDHNALMVSGGGGRILSGYPETLLSANTLYRVGIRPTGTTNITIYSTDVNEVGHMSCLPGGALFSTWTRLDQGAWEGNVTTRRLWAGIRLSAFDDGIGSGGGGPLVGGRFAA